MTHVTASLLSGRSSTSTPEAQVSSALASGQRSRREDRPPGLGCATTDRHVEGGCPPDSTL